MIRCLYCGKQIDEKAAGQELRDRWHHRCIRKFFGVNELPELDISEKNLIRIAKENTENGLTVPGVQKKMSLHLSFADGKPRLTIVDYPAGYILKPQTEQYENLPEAEYLVMGMAERTGIEVVPNALIRMSGEPHRTAYITKRIDRVFSGRKKDTVQKLAMEDFCQLDGRLTENKYLGSYERCAKLIRQYSVRPGLDLAEFFLRTVFSFACGNSDMHLKNFSLIETYPESNEYILSAAYDLLPVNLFIPGDADQTALTLNGKKRNIHRGDFIRFAQTAGVDGKAAVNMIERVISMESVYAEMCEQSYLSDRMKKDCIALISERIAALRPL